MEKINAFFGPAGRDDSLFKYNYKIISDIPRCMSEKGLTAFEYQCGRGVNINSDAASVFKQEGEKYNIKLSLHAPYYISLSSIEEEKRDKSIDYILSSAKAAKMIGADRIIVHSGSCGKISRNEALFLASNTLKKAVETLDENGLSDIHICPETMGKVNQLGTLEEVLKLCEIDERMIPCVDFGHLNARTFGMIKSEKDYKVILDKMENEIGIDRLRFFHSHFSKIEYTVPGGEKNHLTFSDDTFGPDFEPLLNQIVKRGLFPTFICESAGTQSDDSLSMKRYYDDLRNKNIL